MLEKVFPRRSFLHLGAGILFSCSPKITESEQILSDGETKALIETILLNNKGKYENSETNVLFSLGEADKFYVDYVVKKTDGTNAVINHIGQSDNSARELSNQEILKRYFIPNLYFGSGTKSEITLKMNDFINRRFKD